VLLTSVHVFVRSSSEMNQWTGSGNTSALKLSSLRLFDFRAARLIQSSLFQNERTKCFDSSIQHVIGKSIYRSQYQETPSEAVREFL